MLVQLLAERVCVDLDVSSLIEAEKAGITNVKKRITEMVSEEDWL